MQWAKSGDFFATVVANDLPAVLLQVIQQQDQTS
jgi:hypothetical protein